MKSVLKIVLLLLIISGIALVVLFRDQLDIADIENWVKQSGAAAPLVFMLIYIIGTVVFFPGSVLTLAGGALFGPVLGTFYNLTAATIGAAIAFIAARYLASDVVEQRLGPRLKTFKHGVEAEGWRFVAFVRLVPLFPFNLLNYALGLTRIKFITYTLVSYLCMLPGALAYTYLGYLGREAVSGDEALVQKVLIGIALLAVVSLLPGFIRRLRQKPMIDVAALQQKKNCGDDYLLLDVRSESEYNGEQGHIEGSVLVPLEELENNIERLSAYKQRPVFTICRTDKRSAKAATILQAFGFRDVVVVQQGMTAWNAAGYPVLR